MKHPLVTRDRQWIEPCREIVCGTDRFIPYPKGWPAYHNGCNEPCDMLQGPCACGAWHDLTEWTIVVPDGATP
jgi:hypothetical protein